MQQQESQFTPSNTIYLNNLPYGEGPSDFQEVQAAIKKSLSSEDADKVDEIKVRDRRDRPDTYSVYALVKFRTPETVTKLLAKGNMNINGKQVKIETYAGEREYHIYIKNIHSLTAEQIHKHFEQFGQVHIELKQLDGQHIYNSEDHNSCLVRFVKPEDAEKCLQKHQQNIQGTTLWVERYISKEQRHEEYHRLFLNRIPVRAENRIEIEAIITEQMNKYGKLARKIDVQFKEAQPKLGHAIIYFVTQAMAEQARVKFNRNLLASYSPEPLELDNFISKKDRDNKGQLYVWDVLPTIDHNHIRELFDKYGKVEAINLSKYTHAKGMPCLRGTITFEDKYIKFIFRNSINQVLSEAEKDKPLCQIFVEGEPKVNIYLSKQERQEYFKAIKKGKNQQPQGMNMPIYSHPMMMPQNFYGMAPGFSAPMMNSMGMPMNMSSMGASPGYMPLQPPGMMPLQPPGMIPMSMPRRN